MADTQPSENPIAALLGPDEAELLGTRIERLRRVRENGRGMYASMVAQEKAASIHFDLLTT